MENQYLTEESKKEIIKVLVDEYEKILISETVSKSNNSALEKKHIEEFVNYLQTNKNITYADLNEKFRWPGLGKILKKIGTKVLGPLGTAIDIYDTGTNIYQVGEKLYDLWKNPPKPPPDIPLPGGGSIAPGALPLPGIGQVFQGFRENLETPRKLPERYINYKERNMNHQHLIKENIQKLILHHRKTIINEIVQSGALQEGFRKNIIPKDLTEEQLLYVISEAVAEDGNFIIENYEFLTHPNPTREMLDESRIRIDRIVKIGKGIAGLAGDAWKAIQRLGKWVWQKVGDTWEWVWKGQGQPTSPRPTQPGITPPDDIDIPKPKHDPRKQIGPLDTPNGLPHDDNGDPWPDFEDYDIDPATGAPDLRPNPNDSTIGGGALPESINYFNHNMKYLMESNRQIDLNFLHTMLNQINESKYLLELAIQRNQVNRIIDRI